MVTYTCEVCGAEFGRSDTFERHTAKCGLPDENGALSENENVGSQLINVDIAKRLVDMHIMGATYAQHRFSSLMRGFDERTIRNRDKYEDIYRALADKYGIRLTVPPEIALGIGVSQDLAASVLSRIVVGGVATPDPAVPADSGGMGEVGFRDQKIEDVKLAIVDWD